MDGRVTGRTTTTDRSNGNSAGSDDDVSAGATKSSRPGRRRVLAGLSVTALGGLAGCLGDVTEHESTPYGVEEGTAADAGYDLSEVDTVVIEEPVGIGPLGETVVAMNHVVEYEKALDMGPLGEQRGGVFVTFSTPQVSVFGREFNPVADMDTRELVDLVQDSYGGMENVERDADEEIEVLDETVEMTRFEAEATFDGSSVDVDVHVTEAVATEDDLVVTVGVYPTVLRDVEEDHTRSMVGGVASDVDLGGTGGNASTDEENGGDAEEDEEHGGGNEEDDGDGDDGGDDGDDGGDDGDDDDGLLP